MGETVYKPFIRNVYEFEVLELLMKGMKNLRSRAILFLRHLPRFSWEACLK